MGPHVETEARRKKDERRALNPPLTNLCHPEPMKQLIPLILLGFLAACGASPAVEFMNATRTDVTVNGRN